MEYWKNVIGYEELYMVSSHGRIKSLLKDDLIMKFKEDKDGYLHVGLTRDSKQKTFIVHRIVAINFIDNPENLPEVNHKDLNKKNNKKENLEWNSLRQNKHHFHKDKQNNTGILKTGKTFKVQFTVNRKLFYIGTFSNYETALLKYNEAFANRDNEKELNKIIYRNKQKFTKHDIQRQHKLIPNTR